MITTQQQLDFGPDREADRAERLRRVAQLAASTSTTTAKHMFDDDGEAEARRIAEGTGGHQASRAERA